MTYHPAGPIENIPGSLFGVLPVRLFDDKPDKPAIGYVLIEWVNEAESHYITHTGLFISPFGAVVEAVSLVNIAERRRDPKSR